MIGTAKGLARMVHRRLLELRLLGRFMLRLRTYQPRRVIKKNDWDRLDADESS